MKQYRHDELDGKTTDYQSINQSINKFIAGNKAHKHTDTQTNIETIQRSFKTHLADRPRQVDKGLDKGRYGSFRQRMNAGCALCR